MTYKILAVSIMALSCLFSCSEDHEINPKPVLSLKLEYGTVTDIEGNHYKTVKIGNQWWMAENLHVGHYRNGDSIQHVTVPNDWLFSNDAAWCFYNNDTAMGVVYGKLYNWDAVIDPRGLAPAGWHIPGDGEWSILTATLGGSSDAGGHLKEKGNAHWFNPNKASNLSGFSALPGGFRAGGSMFSDFVDIGSYGYWWTSSISTSPDFPSYASCRILYFDNTIIDWYIKPQSCGFSVRCVKDN